MTKLLDQAVQTARNLAPAQQDEIAQMMLAYAKLTVAEELTPDEEAALALSEAAAARGEFATDEQVRAIWAKHGL